MLNAVTEKTREAAVRIGDADLLKYQPLFEAAAEYAMKRAESVGVSYSYGKEGITQFYLEQMSRTRIEYLQVFDALLEGRDISEMLFVEAKYQPEEGWTVGSLTDFLLRGEEESRDLSCQSLNIHDALDYAKAAFFERADEIEAYRAVYERERQSVERSRAEHDARVEESRRQWVKENPRRASKKIDENLKTTLAEFDRAVKQETDARKREQKILEDSLKMRLKTAPTPAEKTLIREDLSRVHRENRELNRLTGMMNRAERKYYAGQEKYERGLLSARAAKRFESNASFLRGANELLQQLTGEFAQSTTQRLSLGITPSTDVKKLYERRLEQLNASRVTPYQKHLQAVEAERANAQKLFVRFTREQNYRQPVSLKELLNSPARQTPVREGRAEPVRTASKTERAIGEKELEG